MTESAPTADDPADASPTAATTPEVHACRNCGTEVARKHCPDCGQRRVESPLRTGEILRDLWSTAIDVDRGFLRTFLGLLRSPGKTIGEYVDGKRAAHASPFRYFLIVMAAWFAFPALIGFDYVEYATIEFERAGAAWPQDGAFGGEAMSSMLERFKAATFRMYEWRRWTALNNLLIYAVGGQLLFRKSRHSFAAWCAFGLYLTAQTLILGIFGFVLIATGLDLVNSVLSLAVFPYAIWTYHGFTGESIGASIVKGVVVIFGGGTLLFVLMMVTALLLGA